MWYHTIRSPPPTSLGQRYKNHGVIDLSDGPGPLGLQFDAINTDLASISGCMRRLGWKLYGFLLDPPTALKVEEPNNANSGDTTPPRARQLWEYGGDAIADARMYEGEGARKDTALFHIKYGLQPGRVLKISE